MSILSRPTRPSALVRTMKTEHKPLNVWIVEDSEIYRNSIEQVIDATKDLRLTASFNHCEALLTKYTFFSETDFPDVILLDIMLNSVHKNKMTGLEGIAEIKKCLPAVPIVMLTGHDAPDLIFRALRSGASGYLNKSSSSTDIQDAIRMASRGGLLVPPAVATKLLLNFQEADIASEKALTRRELEVVELMAKGKSRKMIGEALFISPNTVDSHLNKIYNKLHVTTGTEAIAKIYGARSPLRPKGDDNADEVPGQD